MAIALQSAEVKPPMVLWGETVTARKEPVACPDGAAVAGKAPKIIDPESRAAVIAAVFFIRIINFHIRFVW
ncbi:hypothetical protein GCM10027402_03220 [Arthrobacter monumenti]